MKIKSVPVRYDAAAHFAVSERYPEGLIPAIQKGGVESFDAVLYAFYVMAKEAELYRRFMGETPKRILTEEEWRMIIKPGQLTGMTERVLSVMTAGLSQDEDEDQEIDEVLQELEKKTGH